MKGQDGARKFWTNYLAAFEKIRSTFHHTIDTDENAVLEWGERGRHGGHGPAI